MDENAVQRAFQKKFRLVNRVLSRLPQGVAVYAPDRGTLLYVSQRMLECCHVGSEEELMVLLEKEINRMPAEPAETCGVLHLSDGCELAVQLSRYRFDGENCVQFSTAERPPSPAPVRQEQSPVQTGILLKALATEYAELYLLDPVSGSMQPLPSGEARSYGDWSADLLARCCCEEHREEAGSLLSLPQVLTDIAYGGRHEVRLRMRKAADQDTYALVRFLPGGGPQDGILCGVLDVNEEMRTELHHREQLHQALEEAKAANNAKTVFLSNMSHYIRTPMNAIVGFTQLAIKNIDDRDRTLNYLKKISASGSHLLSLINDVLDMSRIESGRMQLTEEKAEIPEIARELCDMVRPDAENRKLHFEFEQTNVRNTFLYCDVLRLKQLLLNLLSNAVKFTPAGGTVHFALLEKTFTMQGSASYVFTVRDTGIDIAPEFMERLFVPFERQRNSTVSGIQGTGLGMSICKSRLYSKVSGNPIIMV